MKKSGKLVPAAVSCYNDGSGRIPRPECAAERENGMKLVFVRHGDPNYIDNCLTPLGHRQAEALARRLEACGTDFAAIYSSKYGRAVETAEHSAKRLHKDVIILDFIHEISYGLTGMPPEERDRYSPWIAPVELVRNGIPLVNYDPENFWAYKDTRLEETTKRVREGFDAWLEELGFSREGEWYRCSRENNDTLLIFAHGGSISCILGHIMSVNVLAACVYLRLNCTGISEVEFRSRPGKLIIPLIWSVNDHAHLEDAAYTEPKE